MENIPTDIGGKIKFDMNSWIDNRAKLEGVSLTNPSPLAVAPQIIAAFSDFVSLKKMQKNLKSLFTIVMNHHHH